MKKLFIQWCKGLYLRQKAYTKLQKILINQKIQHYENRSKHKVWA